MWRTSLHHRAVALLWGWGASACWAQASAPGPTPPPLSRECLVQAAKLLNQANALHDGIHKGQLPMIRGDELAKVLREGQPGGQLPTLSFITPASVYTVVVVPGPDLASSSNDCPLHRTYIRFVQGGFNPRGPFYYGPIRSGDL